MLMKITFAYWIKAVPRRARIPRMMTFLSSTTVEIEEATAAETPTVATTPVWGNPDPFAAEPLSDLNMFPDSDDIVSHRGRMFRRLRRSDGKTPIPASSWAAEMGSDRGSHIMPLRDGRDIPDIFGLIDLAKTDRMSHLVPDGRPPSLTDLIEIVEIGASKESWPNQRIEEIPLRHIVENGHASVETMIARRASRALIRDGVPYVETGEPLWLLLAPPGGQRKPHLRIIPPGSWGTLRASAADTTVPFATYEVFPIDARDDLAEAIAAMEERSGRADFAKLAAGARAAPVSFSKDFTSSFRPLPRMLPHLIDYIGKAGEKAIAPKDRGWVSEPPEQFIEILSGWRPPSADVHRDNAILLRDFAMRMAAGGYTRRKHHALAVLAEAATIAADRIDRETPEVDILDAEDETALGRMP